jgi:hypothetical protein
MYSGKETYATGRASPNSADMASRRKAGSGERDELDELEQMAEAGRGTGEDASAGGASGSRPHFTSLPLPYTFPRRVSRPLTLCIDISRLSLLLHHTSIVTFASARVHLDFAGSPSRFSYRHLGAAR